jgi:phage terminase Nu1 subunit (DNA packaging protein)
MEKIILNRKDLAQIFGKSTNTITAWLTKGCPLLPKKGSELQFDAGAVIKWREEYLKSSDAINAQKEKARLDRARANKAELEYSVMVVNKVDFALMENAMTNLISACCARLKSLPKKIAPAVFNCSSIPMTEAEIRQQLYGCISGLQKMETEQFTKQP